MCERSSPGELGEAWARLCAQPFQSQPPWESLSDAFRRGQCFCEAHRRRDDVSAAVSQGTTYRFGVGHGENFRMSARGVIWTAANQGVVADSVQSAASDTASERFCNEQFLHNITAFQLARYGQETAEFAPLLGGTHCSTGSTCTWTRSRWQRIFFDQKRQTTRSRFGQRLRAPKRSTRSFGRGTVNKIEVDGSLAASSATIS